MICEWVFTPAIYFSCTHEIGSDLFDTIKMCKLSKPLLNVIFVLCCSCCFTDFSTKYLINNGYYWCDECLRILCYDCLFIIETSGYCTDCVGNKPVRDYGFFGDCPSPNKLPMNIRRGSGNFYDFREKRQKWLTSADKKYLARRMSLFYEFNEPFIKEERYNL